MFNWFSKRKKEVSFTYIRKLEKKKEEIKEIIEILEPFHKNGRYREEIGCLLEELAQINNTLGNLEKLK